MQAEISTRLEEIMKYLKPMLPLANCHMVNFITHNLWETHVPSVIREEVESGKLETLNKIFLHFAKESVPSTPDGELKTLANKLPNFVNFLRSAKDASLRGTIGRGMVTEKTDLWNKLGVLDLDLHIEQFMSYKKTHEVEVMSATVAALTRLSHTSHIVDVGGGKGYLSSFLALRHGLKVLGVDSSHTNTHGAATRIQKLEKMWTGLCRRAEFLKQGSTPPRRGKHWKSHSNNEDDSCNQVTDEEESYLSRKESERCSLYKQVTAFVTDETDLCSLVKKEFECSYGHNLCLVGLHTCGNLAPTCLQIFAEKEEFASLCNVGCCYHLIEEKYVHNPVLSDGDSQLPTEIQYGFPLSQFLQSEEFSLGRNARMLASQSLDRMEHHRQVPSEPLFFRALLQVLLVRKNGDNIPWGQVGRLTSKCRNFTDYVHKAIQKLHLNINVDGDEIEALYKEYSFEQERLHIFFLLRVSLAPVIETVVLLDRLLYLHEQGFADSYLVQLFDPVISPRSYCILALKRKNEQKRLG